MCTSNMMKLLLIFHVKLEIFIMIIFLGDRSGVGFPIVGQESLQALAHQFLVWGWVKEIV